MSGPAAGIVLSHRHDPPRVDDLSFLQLRTPHSSGSGGCTQVIQVTRRDVDQNVWRLLMNYWKNRDKTPRFSSSMAVPGVNHLDRKCHALSWSSMCYSSRPLARSGGEQQMLLCAPHPTRISDGRYPPGWMPVCPVSPKKDIRVMYTRHESRPDKRVSADAVHAHRRNISQLIRSVRTENTTTRAQPAFIGEFPRVTGESTIKGRPAVR